MTAIPSTLRFYPTYSSRVHQTWSASPREEIYYGFLTQTFHGSWINAEPGDPEAPARSRVSLPETMGNSVLVVEV